jgi:hypothetical protein
MIDDADDGEDPTVTSQTDQGTGRRGSGASAKPLRGIKKANKRKRDRRVSICFFSDYVLLHSNRSFKGNVQRDRLG